MTIQNVIKNGLCLGCGICTYDSSINYLAYSKNKGMNIPIVPNKTNLTIADKVCPGSGYPIIEDATLLYGPNKYNIHLGFYDEICVAHSTNSKVLEKASSGGMMTELLLFLLNNNVVDKVAVTKFIYSEKGPTTRTFLTSNPKEIFNSQGSKYCPVDISNVLDEIKKESCRIAYLGTPCQIAGIRQIQKIDKHFKTNIVLTISNFCGGFKSFNQIKKIGIRHSIKFNDITYLQFRGGGQPGGMVLEDINGNIFKAPYPEYSGYTGVSKLLRCHLCVDATGELADFALGDAWLDKYMNDFYPWSVVITRTKFASELIKSMESKHKIVCDTISEDLIYLSQYQNIKSKKIRQSSRFKLYHMLGYKLPNFDGGYLRIKTSMRDEILVFLVHKIKNILEYTGLYKYYRLLMRKKY